MVDFTTGYWKIRDSMDWSQPLVFTDENDVAYDFTGSTFRMDIKAAASDAVAVLSLTTANGGVASTDLANGTITLNIADFALEPGTYVADLIRITGSVREFLMAIEITVAEGVTGA